jgi:hypothetical protein
MGIALSDLGNVMARSAPESFRRRSPDVGAGAQVGGALGTVTSLSQHGIGVLAEVGDVPATGPARAKAERRRPSDWRISGDDYLERPQLQMLRSGL